jgi:hypothetical protein
MTRSAQVKLYPSSTGYEHPVQVFGPEFFHTVEYAKQVVVYARAAQLASGIVGDGIETHRTVIGATLTKAVRKSPRIDAPRQVQVIEQVHNDQVVTLLVHLHLDDRIPDKYFNVHMSVKAEMLSRQTCHDRVYLYGCDVSWDPKFSTQDMDDTASPQAQQQHSLGRVLAQLQVREYALPHAMQAPE